MPFTESLKRSPGRQDGDGGGGAERTTIQATLFFQKIARVLKSEEVGFAGEISLAGIISPEIDRIDEPHIPESLKKEKFSVIFVCPPDNPDLNPEAEILAMVDSSQQIRIDAADPTGFSNRITIPDLSENPEGGWMTNGTLINAGKNVLIKQGLIELGKKKNGNEGVLVIGIEKTAFGRFFAYVTAAEFGPGWKKTFFDEQGHCVITKKEVVAAPESPDLKMVYQTIAEAAQKQLGVKSVRPEDLLLLLEPRLKFMPEGKFPPDLSRSLMGKLLLLAPVAQRVSPKGTEIFYHYQAKEPHCSLYLDLLAARSAFAPCLDILVKELPQEGEIMIIAKSQTENKVVSTKVTPHASWQGLFDEKGNVRKEKLTAPLPKTTPTATTRVPLSDRPTGSTTEKNISTLPSGAAVTTLTKAVAALPEYRGPIMVESGTLLGELPNGVDIFVLPEKSGSMVAGVRLTFRSIDLTAFKKSGLVGPTENQGETGHLIVSVSLAGQEVKISAKAQAGLDKPKDLSILPSTASKLVALIAQVVPKPVTPELPKMVPEPRMTSPWTRTAKNKRLEAKQKAKKDTKLY